jgi:hypothetical protein
MADLLVQSHNAAGRHSGEFVRAAILGHQLIPIGAGRATGDTPLVTIAGKPDGSMPRPIVGHWTLDRKYSAVEIGDDEEEWGLNASHRPLS